MEIAILCIYKVGVADYVVGLRTASSYFDGSIEGKTILDIGVRAIDCKTNGSFFLYSIHEDAVGDMAVVDIGRINTTCVGAVVEGTMVDNHSAFDCS